MRLIADVFDYGDPDEMHVDGISGVYRLSQNVICVEMYRNKVIDGKLQKTVVLRTTWDGRAGSKLSRGCHGCSETWQRCQCRRRSGTRKRASTSPRKEKAPMSGAFGRRGTRDGRGELGNSRRLPVNAQGGGAVPVSLTAAAPL